MDGKRPLCVRAPSVLYVLKIFCSMSRLLRGLSCDILIIIIIIMMIIIITIIIILIDEDRNTLPLVPH